MQMGNAKKAQRIYAKRAGLYHLIFFDILRYDKAVRLFFRKSGYLHKNSKVLDAGCGSGLVAKSLYAVSIEEGIKGVNIHAFDITEAMLGLFRKWIQGKGIKNIELRQADALKLEKLPKDWKNYGLAVSSAMLEHIPKEELVHTLRSLKALLKRKGTILVFITKKNAITQWLVGRWWGANAYGQDEFKKMAAKAGLKKIQFKKFPFPYSYFNKGMLVMEAKKD